MTPKQKSRQQVAFLLSKGSPLPESKKDKLKRELQQGLVKVKPARAKR
jgi:hypothetical protein